MKDAESRISITALYNTLIPNTTQTTTIYRPIDKSIIAQLKGSAKIHATTLQTLVETDPFADVESTQGITVEAFLQEAVNRGNYLYGTGYDFDNIKSAITAKTSDKKFRLTTSPYIAIVRALFSKKYAKFDTDAEKRATVIRYTIDPTDEGDMMLEERKQRTFRKMGFVYIVPPLPDGIPFRAESKNGTKEKYRFSTTRNIFYFAKIPVFEQDVDLGEIHTVPGQWEFIEKGPRQPLKPKKPTTS